tara:strand:- start:33848 stop:36565 length:2718 start_codon:yes stop_codon:yes gene_type:complete
MASNCETVAMELASSLTNLSASSQVHCEACPSCEKAARQASALGESITRLKRLGDEELRGIDLSARLLKTIEEQEAKPWRLRFALVAAFAGLLLAFWQWPSGTSPQAVSLDAPRGAELVKSGGVRVVKGKTIGLDLPLTLATREKQDATLRMAKATINVAPNTRLTLRDTGALGLDHGIVEISNERPNTSQTSLNPIQLTSNALPTLTLRGHAIVEHLPGTTPMKLLKRHKVLAVTAVAAVVLYSGYATITSGDSEETITAPAGLYVDGEGETHSFDPTKQGNAANELAALANGVALANAESDADEDDSEASGAYWSDAEQVVQFRIRGEAFDADTGHPLEGFELTAGLLESGDFNQRKAITESFDSLVEGRFVLGGLGIGTWRITATREGYAPVIQTLEIADLRASPYLVIPLSSTGAKLSGRVIDWQGRPVAGAKIGLASCLQGKASDKPEAGCNLVSSDTQGRFVIDKLPEEETFSLYAKHDRYGFATSSNLHSAEPDEAPGEGDEPGQHITIRLSGVVRIYGRVVKGKEKTPVASAVVEGAGDTAQTSATGDYELIVPLEETPEAYVVSYPGSPKGLAIHSYPENRSARPLEWVDAQDHAAQVRIDFFLEMSDANLVGTIRDSKGKPVAGVNVSLMNTNGWKNNRGHQTFPTKAITDAGGNYKVANIPAKAGYRIIYRLNEDEDWQELGYVNIPEEGEVRADFQLGSASIRGRFVKSDTGAPMVVDQMSCSRLGAERADAAGVFALAHCYPDGRFEIVGLQSGTYILHNKTDWMAGPVTFESETVTLAPGQLLTDVEVKVDGESAKLWRFRILSTENEFLVGAYIQYQVGDSSTTSTLHILADGTAKKQINESIKEILLEVPGYEPMPVNLSEHSPERTIEVRLTKSPESADDAEGSEDAE